MDSILFTHLNLQYKGLERIDKLVKQGDYNSASIELLKYYQNREGIKHPDFVDIDREKTLISISKKEKEMAENGLKHLFYVHKGYGYFDYGEDINWQYWPVKDNEIRWQLHRMYWWIPMGKMYWNTHNETYAKEWFSQIKDWIQDNPMGLSKENDRFAWRQLETARRVQDQTNIFILFKDSPNFSPQFLIQFLENYYIQANRVHNHYTNQGNHRLFEAQRMIYAGCFFPEFKDAKTWREKGVEILNQEIQKQVLNDGYQFELCPLYHVASIEIFLKALRMAQLSGLENVFPESYKNKVEAMILATIKTSFPDLVYPMFGDSKQTNYEIMLKHYKEWSNVFPNNPIIKYFASEGTQGVLPNYLSTALTDCGFYTFRNGWDKNATVLIMKAGPKGHFHCQPDNGTFELWYKGVNLMPDAGCYVYSGNQEIQALRNQFRETQKHQTLTWRNQNIELGAKLNYWNTSDTLDILSYTNPSYPKLTHTRKVYFVDHRFFIIDDCAEGDATGEIELHFHVKEGKASIDTTNFELNTHFKEQKNVFIKALETKNIHTKQQNSKVSYAYRKETDRKEISFVVNKQNKEIHFLTLIYPYEGNKHPKIEYSTNANNTKIVVNNTPYELNTLQ